MSDFPISPKEAEDLDWYFSEGESSFCHSISGPLLSKAELYYHGGFKCYDCREFPGIDPVTGDWCKKCEGVGYRHYKLKPKDEITARPTAETIQTKGYEPRYDEMHRYGRIARRLDALSVIVGGRGPSVLEAYHGDSGARWGRTKHGRLFALLPFTQAGKEILKRSREEDKNNELFLPEDEKLFVQVETLQSIQPKAWRRTLINKAAKQAEKLYHKVAAAWMLTAGDTSATVKPKSKLTSNPKKTNPVWTEGTAPARTHYDSFEALRAVVAPEVQNVA